MSMGATRREVGRYVLCDEIASGGMARVYLGRLRGPVGFTRTVALKGLHPALARDPAIVATLIDEARLLCRVRHPNVVPVLDVVSAEGELWLVMEYVHGVSLGRLVDETSARGERVPAPIAVGIVVGLLQGLHAAHEATGEDGAPLGIVHRDVSPQNVMVGTDGVTRVLDFGIAKATTRAQSTLEGQLKGKLRYMSCEQLRGLSVDRRSDVFAASVVLWETLCGRKLFDGEDPGPIVTHILTGELVPPRALVPDLPEALDHAVLRGLAREPGDRFPTARDMASALEHAVQPATAREIGEWVERTGGEPLRQRIEALRAVETAEAGGGAVELAQREAPTLELGAPAAAAEVRGPAATRGAEASERTALDATRRISLAPARRIRVRTGALVAALIGAAAGVLLSWRASAPRGESDRAASAFGTGWTPPVPAEPPREAHEPSGAGTPAALSVTEAAPSAPAAVAQTSAAPRLPRPAASRRAGDPCDPPYTVEDGIKKFKPQCL
jgi:serine/threonine-protein kinase